jgi:hypothetical protein
MLASQRSPSNNRSGWQILQLSEDEGSEKRYVKICMAEANARPLGRAKYFILLVELIRIEPTTSSTRSRDKRLNRASRRLCGRILHRIELLADVQIGLDLR